jgi:hypothetical protein
MMIRHSGIWILKRISNDQPIDIHFGIEDTVTSLSGEP